VSNIVYTGGTFDLFHSGHVNLLKRCREVAGPDGKVVASLNTDDFIWQFKNKRPVCSESERAEVLLACRYVDEAFIIREFDNKEYIIKHGINIIADGSCLLVVLGYHDH
jgi:cytidyltransferase-like protein